MDSSGNLYASDYFGGDVSEFAPGSNVAERIITGLTAPEFGLAVDAQGDVYVSEASSGRERVYASGRQHAVSNLDQRR